MNMHVWLIKKLHIRNEGDYRSCLKTYIYRKEQDGRFIQINRSYLQKYNCFIHIPSMFLEVGLRFLLLKLLNKNKGMITDIFKLRFVTCN